MKYEITIIFDNFVEKEKCDSMVDRRIKEIMQFGYEKVYVLDKMNNIKSSTWYPPNRIVYIKKSLIET